MVSLHPSHLIGHRSVLGSLAHRAVRAEAPVATCRPAVEAWVREADVEGALDDLIRVFPRLRAYKGPFRGHGPSGQALLRKDLLDALVCGLKQEAMRAHNDVGVVLWGGSGDVAVDTAVWRAIGRHVAPGARVRGAAPNGAVWEAGLGASGLIALNGVPVPDAVRRAAAPAVTAG